MRVAVLVHNSVLRDARVIKEATSLWQAGHLVEIHGISTSSQPEQQQIPGTTINVFLEPKPAPRLQAMGARFHWVPDALIVLGVSSVLAVLSIGSAIMARSLSLFEESLILFGSYLLVVSFLYQRRRTIRAAAHRRRTQLSRTVKRLIDKSRRFKAQFIEPYFKKPLENQNYERIAEALFVSVAKRPPPDVIHIHDNVAFVGARHFRKRYQVPMVWDAHEIYEDLAAGDPDRAALNAAIVKRNCRFVNEFITINQSIAEFYREKYRLPKAVILMNATLPHALPEYDGRLHEAANLPRTQKILLFQGGLAAKRGLVQLVEAAASLRPDWTLVLMGWGNLADHLRALAVEHARDGSVPCTVFVPGVPHHELQLWSAGASLGAIPYENTGLNHLYCTPNKLWEYPAAGVPILATDLIEMGKMIRHYGTGFLLPREFSSDDIAQTVNRLTDQQLGSAQQACAAFIAENNWNHYAPNLIALYDRLQRKRLAPRRGGAEPDAPGRTGVMRPADPALGAYRQGGRSRETTGNGYAGDAL